MKIRSPAELVFRLRQLVANRLDRRLPAPAKNSLRPLPLPSLHRVLPILRETAFAETLNALADSTLTHRFPVFGKIVETGSDIRWRRDYINRIDTPVAWFKQIPYLDFASSGDHKNIWELNRHQHLVTLAQAWAISADKRYIEELEAQLASWHEQNPFVNSVNWASALELGLRALSWLWILHLTGDAMSERTRVLLADLLKQHGVVIAHNLSTYFAPNTHILGEGVALHAIGIALGSSKWQKAGRRIVDRQLLDQILADGFHFELSPYYHLYALDMILFHYLLTEHPPGYEPVIIKMTACLSAFIDSDRNLPLIGDDDGGRFFHPYGSRAGFARATLATCAALFPHAPIAADPADFAEQGAWWTGAPPPVQTSLSDLSAHLCPSGMTVFRRGLVHLTFDCGPFSRGGAGHSHADCLAITLRVDGHDILIDPGTYTYVADAAARDWFRGTSAHSTMRLGGQDQADPVKPFRWDNKPEVRRLSTAEWSAAGECCYRQWVHRRTVTFDNPGVIRVTDEVSGAGTNIEQFWHCGKQPVRRGPHSFQVGATVIELDPSLRIEIKDAWRSRVFGTREKSQILCAACEGPVRSPLNTIIYLPESAKTC